MIIEVKNLVAGYEQRVLLRNLSFSVPAPAFIAIIGHNGVGKSTLFKAFQQKIPYQGHILIQNQDLRHIAKPTATGILGYLPQKNIVSFPIKVHELVVMGLFRKKKFLENYDATDYAQAAQVVAQLQLSDLLDHDFTTLSGGEQQLIWLAQLMLQDAHICLLDEPSQQLDVYYKKQVYSLLQDWVLQHQKTVLCITHDLHNLLPLKGYLLNLSKPAPSLEVISPEVVLQNQEYLESHPRRL
ncbi:ABC transporter ATP-binding protein [Pontibacter qinzhouensis]|uniref:ABC transporter ATP-binding protein n=1 Tax=Pontibacter qinzhouensis TaxID=2603253 RepID=A0A5C8KE55_9BACT|nr:ABC transporter ATP-binding protein [Pontibacter qinzhouensis]TXK52808.1 ABC transporter ATP-binding protein [Pontibacter qinzhouensis]